MVTLLVIPTSSPKENHPSHSLSAEFSLKQLDLENPLSLSLSPTFSLITIHVRSWASDSKAANTNLRLGLLLKAKTEVLVVLQPSCFFS